MITRRRVWCALTLAFLALAALSWRTYRAYNAAGPTSGEKLIPARVQGKYGFINAAGAMVIPPQWEGAWRSTRPDRYWVVWDGIDTFIDIHGSPISESGHSGNGAPHPAWEYKSDFDDEGWALFERNGRLGWVDRQDQVRVSAVWDDAHSFDANGWARVKSRVHWSWIDRTGGVVLSGKWTDAGDFGRQGLARVRVGDNCHWIDRRGEPTVVGEWTAGGDFDAQGWARAKRHGKWGWIDTQGRTVLPFDWDWAGEDFTPSGLAIVGRDEKTSGQRAIGLINRRGDIVEPMKWKDVQQLDGAGFVGRNDNDRYVLIGRTGVVVSPCEWDEVGIDHEVICCYRQVHPLLITAPTWLGGRLTALDLDVLFDGNLRPIWRSDLYLLSRAMPAVGAASLLLSCLCAWRWRKAGRAATAASAA